MYQVYVTVIQVPSTVYTYTWMLIKLSNQKEGLQHLEETEIAN